LNLAYDNLEILIIQHLRRVVPRPGVLHLSSSMKQADLKGMFRKASKIVCTSAVVVSPDPLSPTPSNERAIQMECSSD
jgi:hypothetical protein